MVMLLVSVLPPVMESDALEEKLPTDTESVTLLEMLPDGDGVSRRDTDELAVGEDVAVGDTDAERDGESVPREFVSDSVRSNDGVVDTVRVPGDVPVTVPVLEDESEAVMSTVGVPVRVRERSALPDTDAVCSSVCEVESVTASVSEADELPRLLDSVTVWLSESCCVWLKDMVPRLRDVENVLERLAVSLCVSKVTDLCPVKLTDAVTVSDVVSAAESVPAENVSLSLSVPETSWVSDNENVLERL